MSGVGHKDLEDLEDTSGVVTQKTEFVCPIHQMIFRGQIPVESKSFRVFTLHSGAKHSCTAQHMSLLGR